MSFSSASLEAVQRASRAPVRCRRLLAQCGAWLVLLGLFLTACAGSPEPQVSQETLEKGARLYTTHCQSCHGNGRGEGRVLFVPSHGPDGHTWHHSDRNLADIIMNGSDAVHEMMRELIQVPEDRPRMPAWRDILSEEDVRAIIAHIKTFWMEEQHRFQRETPTMMR